MRHARRKWASAPRVETLEDKTLLGGNVAIMQSAGTPMSDIRGLQQHASSDNLVVFPSGLAEVTTNRGDVQQFARQQLAQHDQGDYQIHEVAGQHGHDALVDAQPAALRHGPQRALDDQRRHVGDRRHRRGRHRRPVGGVRAGFLHANIMGHQTDINVNQQELARTQDPNLQQFAQDDIATDFLHLTGAQLILDGAAAGNTGNPFGGLIGNINPAQISNPKVRFNPGRNGLNCSLSFDSGGYRFSQNYNLSISRGGGNNNGGNTGALTAQDAIDLFLYLGYQELYGQDGNAGGGQNHGSGNNGRV